MKRKVNLVGQNTLTISLPSKWVEKNNIKKGDELEIEEDGKELSIYTHKIQNKKIKSLKLSIKETFSQRTITTPYVRGYNQIKIDFDDISILDKIEKTLEKTPGFEIIHQEKNYVEIKNIFGENTEEFNTVFERLYNVILVGLQEISSEIKKCDFKDLKIIEKLSRDSDKYELFCRRMMNTNEYQDNKKNYSIYTILKNYELIGDVFKELYFYILKNKISKSLELSILIDKIIGFMKYSHKVYYSNAITEHVIEIKKKRYEFRIKYDETLSKLKSKELVSILGLINLIYYSINHISEETLYLNSEN